MDESVRRELGLDGEGGTASRPRGRRGARRAPLIDGRTFLVLSCIVGCSVLLGVFVYVLELSTRGSGCCRAPGAASACLGLGDELAARNLWREAAHAYSFWLEHAAAGGEEAARVAMKLGDIHWRRLHRPARAIYYYYLARRLAPAGSRIAERVPARVVECLEALGLVGEARDVLASAVSLTPSSSAVSAPVDDPVVATVGGRSITLGELEDAIAARGGASALRSTSGAPDAATLERVLMNELVVPQLFALEAERLGLDTTPEVRRRLREARRRVLFEALLERERNWTLPPSPADLRLFYSRNYASLPGRFTIRGWKWIAFTSREAAGSFLSSARAGGTTTSADAAARGSVPPMSAASAAARGDLPAAAVSLAYSVPADGRWYGPVPDGKGRWYVVAVERVSPLEGRELEAILPRLERIWKARRGRSRISALVEELRRRYPVSVDRSLLSTGAGRIGCGGR